MIDTLAMALAVALTGSEGCQLAVRAPARSARERAAPSVEAREAREARETRAEPEPEAPDERPVPPTLMLGHRTVAPGSSSGAGPSAPRGARTGGAPAGGSAAPTGRLAPGATARPGSGGTGVAAPLVYYTIKIFGGAGGTTTGYREDFMFYAPPRSEPRPLVVIFHKFGVGHMDALTNTSFFQEARERGWYALCHTAASGVHFGSIEGQVNTEVVFDWVFDNFNVDPTRVYGVGFSMGGGAALNFAARHVDPNEYMFAALVDHTGGISLANSYASGAVSTRTIFEFWFTNAQTGLVDPWLLSRSSVLDFDPATLVVDPDTDLAGNLQHVPVRVTRASNEPAATAYLSTESDVLVGHLQSLGGTVENVVVPYSGHSWDMLDEDETLSWLGQHQLQIPVRADTLADHDGAYFHFDVHQDAAAAFTPFSWDVQPAGTSNGFRLWNTANLARLEVDLEGAGLDPGQRLELSLSTADGAGDEILLREYPFAPSLVYRDGVPVSTQWSYDAARRELLLQELEGAQTHVWEILP